MTKLATETCSACRKDAPRVSEVEATQLIEQIPEWQLIDCDGVAQLQREFVFPDFSKALDYANAVGELAEGTNHHPAILVEWGKTTVTWWTHKIGGVHRNDFIMAAKTDFLYNK